MLESIREPDRWLGIELRHLAALEAVGKEGSFSHAARRLGYTQSAISQQIATLERIVGERLVERPGGPRRVSLTEAGQLLLRHAEGITARLAAAQADLSALAKGAAGPLRIGTYQSAGARILPAVMRRFTASWPLVDVQLTESDRELLDLVERGELDLAFIVFPIEAGPFETVELLRDPYVLLLPADSSLAARGEPPSLREIAALPLIGYRHVREVDRVEARLRDRGMTPRIVFRSNDNLTIHGLVAAGVGAALIPRLGVEPSHPDVVVRELGAKLPPRLIGMAWHRDRYQLPAARAFVDTARSVCDELGRQAGRSAA